MNEHVRPSSLDLPPRPRAATQAAEGLPRWRWTTDEVIQMVEAGLLHPDERVELIGGEIVRMSPKGRRHEVLRDGLVRFWSRRLTADIWVSAEPQFNLSDSTYTEPDVLVMPWAIKTYDLRGPDALLVVEVAETSLGYDTGAKAKIYASFGVREYWVINAVTLETRVHLSPESDGYGSVAAYPAAATMTPQLVPALAVRLADLDVS